MQKYPGHKWKPDLQLPGSIHHVLKGDHSVGGILLCSRHK